MKPIYSFIIFMFMIYVTSFIVSYVLDFLGRIDYYGIVKKSIKIIHQFLGYMLYRK